MQPFCSLHILAVLQREILQQQRSADLSAYYTRADALLPRQRDLQWGMLKRDTSLTHISRKLALKCNKLFVEIIFLFLAEIQRGSDVAERPWLLPVRHSRNGPRSQHHQIQGMCLLLDGISFNISILHFYYIVFNATMAFQ